MPIDVKETIDLNYFKRYDANTVAAQVKISSNGFAVSGALEPGKSYALFINKSGTILAIKEDANGIKLNVAGKGSARFGCSRLLADMRKLGVEMPQAADLDWDDSLGGYTARLKVAKSDISDASPSSAQSRAGRRKFED